MTNDTKAAPLYIAIIDNNASFQNRVVAYSWIFNHMIISHYRPFYLAINYRLFNSMHFMSTLNQQI